MLLHPTQGMWELVGERKMLEKEHSMKKKLKGLLIYDVLMQTYFYNWDKCIYCWIYNRNCNILV